MWFVSLFAGIGADALRRCQDGEDPGMVYAELYVNADREDCRDDVRCKCGEGHYCASEYRAIRAAASDARSLLADLATDYDLADHAATHQLIEVVTSQLTDALEGLK